MSFEDSIIKIKSFDDLLNYICKDKCNKYSKNNEPNTITIYHIHIGAKTYISHDTTYSNRNHELTSFLKTLFLEPLKQFSPEFISQLSNYPEIKIRNVVILIDPAYDWSSNLEGFIEMSDTTDTNTNTYKQYLKNEVIVQHHYDTFDTFTTISTSIDILQLPIDITQENIIKLVNHISNLDSVLINIMDCTSRVLLEYYATQMIDSNTNSKIFITHPDCLIIDKLPRYKPIITLDMGMTIGMCMDSETQIPNKLSVRWMNYNDDKNTIQDLEQVLDLDICESYKITHTFLTENYKYNIGFENLISIVKIWSRLSYTNLQEISIFPECDYNDSIDGKSILSIKFCTIEFPDFIRYWKKYSNFRKFIIDNVDDYYRYTLQVYLDIFCNKYEYACEQLNIIEALQIEAIEIFKNLMNYFKNDVKYIIDNVKSIVCTDGNNDNTSYKLLDRKNIIDYLKFNNISL